MANIPDANEPWAGHSGLEVETFIKGQMQTLSMALGGKFGYVTYNPQTMALVFYDQQGGQTLGTIQLGGDVYTIDLHCNLSQVFYVLADENSKIMTIAPTTTKTPFGGGTSQDVPERYTYSVYVNSGSGYVPKLSGEINVGGSVSFDVKPYLLTGDNYIRVSVTGETSGQTQTTIFTGTLTSLFLSCSHAWQNVWEQGLGYTISGIRFAGNLAKTLHVSVKYGTTTTELDPVDYGANVSYTTTSTTYAIPSSAFPVTGEHGGNCTINLWMTAQGISTPVISFDIMCAKTNDTTPLVAINAVVSTAYNFTSGTLFSYAVYNADKAVFTLSATLGSTTYQIVQNQPATGLAPSTQYPFAYSLEVDTGANNTQTGTMAISAKAYAGSVDGPTVTASTVFDNTYSYLATPGYLFYLNAATRSNNSSDRDVIVNDGTPDSHFAATYSASWSGFTWSDDGWAADEDGYRALAVPAGASVSVTNLRPLENFTGYSGMTIELMLKARMPADYSTAILSMASSSVGIIVYPTEILVYSTNESNETAQSVVFAENTITHLVVTFVKNYGNTPGRNLCSIYVNGTSNVNFPFSGLSDFGDGNLVIGQQNTDVYLYKMRVYGTALESGAVFNNFLNCILDGVEFNRANVVAKNAVTDGGIVDYNLCKQAGYNTMVVILPNDSDYLPDINHQAKDKDGTAISHTRVDFEYADSSLKNASIGETKLDGQGTTSMKYYRWNLRFKTSNSTTWTYGDGTTDPNGKKGRMIKDTNYVKVDRITAKKNYASSMQGHKMGMTGLYNDIFHQSPVSLGSHLPNPDYLVAVYQFPFVGFRKYSNNYYEYIGLYTAGPDKSSKTSFGHSTGNDAFPNLMSIEGPNHNPRGTRFITPWIDVIYDQNEETLCINDDEAWDCAIAGPNETSNEGTQAGWDAILSLYNSEWRPAYDCVFNNSPYIASLADALTESGYADLAAINADITGFQTLTTGGIPNELLTFYDNAYDIIIYRTRTHSYVKLSDVASDANLEYNAVTPLYSAGYLSTLSPTTAQIIAARIARFKATAPDYWDMEQLYYHYCFCVLFGVTDNFAKNTYPFKFRAYNESLASGESTYCKRWGWRQDDLDTVLDTDNNGRLTKSYSVEHGDLNSSGKQIFQGGDSALWVIIRDYYQDEQKDMMGRIVQAIGNIATAKGITGNYTHETVFNVVSAYCWEKSAKYFSQTLYEGDRTWSYITPWLENDGIKYNDVYPWEQALGDQYQAEKMWVQRRVVYMFSKYRLGAFTGTDTSYDGLSITLASSYVFSITPAIDLYPVGSTATTDSQAPRTSAGTAVSLPVSAGSGSTNNYIHGLDWIASLGDISDMVLTDRGDDTNIAFSVKSDRLRTLKIGDATAGNVLFNATSLAVESPSITHIDARNTVKVTQSEVNLLKCPRLRTCLFAGSGAPGLILPIGSMLEDVSFPDNALTVFMYSLPFLTSAHLTLPTLSKIRNLYINDCDQLNPLTIASNILATTGNTLSYVTLNWGNIVSASADVLFDLAELSGRVVYDNGNITNVSTLPPDIAGTVQVSGIFEEELDDLDIISEEPYGQGLIKALSDLFGTNLYIIYDPNSLYIRFVDANVEALCATNWGSDGHITKSQAQSVTSIGTVFTNNTTITSFDELQYFTGLTRLAESASALSAGGFSGCTALTSITLPNTITRLAGCRNNALGDFCNCESLERINIPSSLERFGGGSNYNSVFMGCYALARIDITSLNDYLNVIFGGPASHPFYDSTTSARGIYLNGTLITAINIPSTVTEVKSYLFYKVNTLTSVTFPNTVTSIGAYSFYKCTGLTSITVPSSVTSISGYAFAGAINVVNLTINTTIDITTQAFCSTTDESSCGDGTGVFYCAGNLSNSSNYRACFRKYVIGGNFTVTSGNSGSIRQRLIDGRAPVEVFKIEGNYTTNGINETSCAVIYGGANTHMAFVEIMGTITSNYCVLGGDNSNYLIDGAILHLGYDAYTNNAVVCTPTIAGADYSRVAKIYVGKGQSAAEDNNILSVYQNDADWGQYVTSGKVATWYSYINGPDANQYFIN